MKALKEKRVSLRSFLRRGLVILSLFALVFASCSDSSGGTDNTGGTGGTNPPAPKVISISIIQQPTATNYQGTRADLTGLVAEVLMEGSSTPIRETDISKFTTLPGYIDRAGVNNGDLTLMYLGQAADAMTTKLILPKVIPVTKIEVTQDKQVAWFADQRPDFSGLTLDLTYEGTWDGGAKYVRKSQKMTPAYPNVTYTDIQAKKKVTVTVGPLVGGTTIASPNDSTTTNWENNARSTDFPISAYYEVLGVTVKGIGDYEYYDDNFSKFFNAGSTAVIRGNKSIYPNEIDPDKVYNELKASGVTFEVSYKGTEEKHTLTMDEFVANSKWYYEQQGLGNGVTVANTYMLDMIVAGSDGFKIETTRDGVPVGGGARIFNIIADDELTWNVHLEYAPGNYNTSASLAKVTVPLQMYIFGGDIRKKYNGPTEVTIEGGDGLNATGTNLGIRQIHGSEVTAINQKWKLEGNYAKGRDQKWKVIDITAQMFSDGWFGSSAVAIRDGLGGWASVATHGYQGITGGGGASVINDYNMSVNLNANYEPYLANNGLTSGFYSAGKGQYARTFPLPVYYRGGYIEDDADSTITVDLLVK
jgi:hypothetical protein